MSRERPDAPVHATVLHAFNSANRLNRSDSPNNFTIRVAAAVGRETQRHIALRSAAIPNRFVNISTFADDTVKQSDGTSYRANNILQFTSGGNTLTITIREGHYEIIDVNSPLIAALHQLFFSASVAAVAQQSAILSTSGSLALATAFQAHASAYASIDQGTGVLRLNWNSAAALTLVNNRLARDLGLYASYSDTAIATAAHSATTPFIGVNPPQLPEVTHINLNIAEMEPNFYALGQDQRDESIVRIRDLHWNTLACIPVTAAFGETQMYDPTDLEHVELGKEIPFMHISLTDQLGNPLRMPVNWTCVIMFEKAHSQRRHDQH